MKKINLIMPMAGKGSRFEDAGFNVPKPLITLHDKPMFYWSVQSLKKYISIESLVFVVLKEHVDKYNIDKEIKKYYPNSEIVILPEVTKGAVITGIKGLSSINNSYPVVFNDCDHYFSSKEFNDYCLNDDIESYDGILLTFSSDKPIYSYVGFDQNGNVNRTVEKEVISNSAICGCYYFKNKDLFLKAAEEYLDSCSYKEFYMSGVYNVLIKNGFCVRSMNTDFHIPAGVPKEYEEAKKDCLYNKLV